MSEVEQKQRSKFRRTSPTQVEVACAYCGTILYLRPSTAHSSERHYCNRVCKGKYRSEHFRGAQAPHWCGGKASARGGRIRIYVPDHPDANRRGYVWRHRLVMEQKLGRRLLPTEVVHHLDGNPRNDDPANLVLMASQSEHVRHFHGKGTRWARDWDRCVECGGTDRRHASQGRCYRCYDRVWRKEHRRAQR